jgi:hypothetical protein
MVIVVATRRKPRSQSRERVRLVGAAVLSIV